MYDPCIFGAFTVTGCHSPQSVTPLYPSCEDTAIVYDASCGAAAANLEQYHLEFADAVNFITTLGVMRLELITISLERSNALGSLPCYCISAYDCISLRPWPEPL
jgi:hypothetical protein